MQTGETQTAVAAAFAASLKKKKKKVETVPGKAMIQTSLIRTNALTEKEDGTQIVSYLSLLNNGGYLLKDEYSHIDNQERGNRRCTAPLLRERLCQPCSVENLIAEEA